jgi:hypothetical protein
MDTTQLQGLIAIPAVLGLLALVVLPAIIGVVHDRRIDRQLREAEARAAALDGAGPERHTRDTSAQAHRIARATWKDAARRTTVRTVKTGGAGRSG